MKKMKLFLTGILAMFIAIGGASADGTTLPAAKDGIIKLTEDYTLAAEYKVERNTTLTIDLNGHDITAAAAGYAINNLGTLTIIDSSSAKAGTINGNNVASAIRNDGTLTADGVKVNSGFVALKNEAGSKMTVTNSTIKVDYTAKLTEDGTKVESGLGIQNYGTLTVKNTNITAKNGSNAINNNASGSVELTDSVLVADSVKLAGTADNVGKAVSTDEKGKIVVKDSVVNGDIKGNVTLSGEVTTSLENMKYAEEGTRIVLNADTSVHSDVEVLKGVTLVIPDDVKLSLEVNIKNAVIFSVGSLAVKGAIEGTVDAVAYNEDTNTYYASLERAVLPATTKDGQTVVVLKDTTENSLLYLGKASGKMPISNDIKINLNGHKVTANLENKAETTLTIVDETGDGELIGTIANSGNLVIESGKFAHVPTNALGAVTTINGGVFPADEMLNQKLPEDKKIVKNEDGTVSVVDKYADYSALDELLEVAEAVDESKYTAESYAALAEAIKTAKALNRKILAEDQDEVDAVVEALSDAYEGLVEAEASGATPGETNPEGNPNTLDSLPVYLIGSAVAVLGVAGLGYSIKKKFEN